MVSDDAIPEINNHIPTTVPNILGSCMKYATIIVKKPYNKFNTPIILNDSLNNNITPKMIKSMPNK